MGMNFDSPLRYITLLCLLISSKVVSVSGLQVLGVVGGGAVVNGSSPLLVLDCQYIIPPGEEAGLVISWYHGPNPRPVYQWIPGSPPQALGILRGRLDLNYHSSPDTLKAHSALAFVTPTTELAGEYTCRVSTYFAEEEATGSLVVYSQPSQISIKMKKKTFGKLSVSCYVRDIFPEPNIIIYKTDVSTKSRIIMNGKIQKTYDVEKNAFSIEMSASILRHQIAGETKFECSLSIPGTKYRRKETLLYYTGFNSERLKAEGGRSFTTNSAVKSLCDFHLFIFIWVLIAVVTTGTSNIFLIPNI